MNEYPVLREELSAMILRLMLEDETLSWDEAYQAIADTLADLRDAHEAGQPLTERDEARADAVAEGNPEGFSLEPEPLPDAFLDEGEDR